MKSGLLLASALCLLLFAGGGLPAAAVLEGGYAQPRSGSGLLGLRTLGSASGLPQLTVFALAEGGDGWIYAGTQDGLARWDGRSFSRVELVGAARDWVTHLHAETSGLWIGTDHNGLQLLTDAGVNEVPGPDGRLPAIEALATAGPGRVWVGTAQGLWSCTPTGCQPEPAAAGLEVAELLPDGEWLWIGTNMDGLWQFRIDPDGTLVRTGLHLGRREGLPNDAVRALLKDPQGRLWIGTGRGLARWDGTRLTRWMRIDAARPLGGVFALRQLARGEVLAVLWSSGLARFLPDDRFEVAGLGEGLPDSYLRTALVSGDPEDPVIWLGTSSSGVLRLEPGRWRSFDERHGLPQRVVVGVGAVMREGREMLWAGTLGGAVRLDGSRWSALLPEPYRSLAVYDVLVDPHGREWYATDRGLLLRSAAADRIDPAEQWQMFDGPQLPAVSVEHLLWFEDRLWVGTGHGLVRVRALADGRLQFERAFVGQAEHRDLAVRSMAVLSLPGRGERVLLGTGDGPVLTDGVTTEALPPACAAGDTIYDIELMQPDEAWLGTRIGPIRVRWDAQGFRCAPVLDPAQAITVFEILRDAAGRAWLFGYDGTHRIEDPRIGPAAGMRSFGLADGLPGLEFNRDALLDPQGRIWATNAEGLVLFDPQEQPRAPRQARLQLRAEHAGQQLAAGSVLGASHGELRFVPRLQSWRQEHLIRYRSRLHGLDPEAGAWSADGDRQFLRMPPGDYRFEVEARDAVGQTFGPVAFEFRIAAPWWQHPLVWVSAVLGLLAIGVLAGRVRARALAARAAQLEALVAERTRALEWASNTDPLTQAWNRRYFHASIHQWLSAGEAGGGLYLLLIDLDHFKQVNDQHGHSVGDAVLVELARRLLTLVPGGQLIRWGGEEFLLVLPAGAAGSLADSAKAVLRTVSATPVRCEALALSMCCSLGCTVVWPSARGLGDHIDSVIARADAALYRAKHSGRDRAVEAIAVAGSALEFRELARGVDGREG